MSHSRVIRTTKLGDRRFSFGYAWNTATSEATLKSDALAEAALPSVLADVVALRAGDGYAQFGLGWLDADDRQKGIVAAHAFAAEHAKQTIRKALGLFEIPGALWLAVLDQDLIDHDGDQVFDDADEALTVFTTFLSQQYWDRLYLPKSYIDLSLARYDQAQENNEPATALDTIVYNRRHTTTSTPISSMPLDQLLRDAEVSTHIQRKIRRIDVAVALRSRPALAVYAVLTLGLCAALPSAYRWVFPEKKPVAVAPVVATPQPAAPPPAVVNTPPPSTASPSPSDVANRCMDQFAALDDPLPPGWTDKELHCRLGAASLSLARTGGMPDALEHAYAGASFQYDDAYNAVTVTLPAAVVNHRGQEDLAPAEEVRRRLFALGWAADERVTVAKFAPPPGRQPADTARWLQASLTITSPTDPREWGAVLDRVPGVTLSSIVIDAHQMKTDPLHVRWIIEGTVYAR